MSDRQIGRSKSQSLEAGKCKSKTTREEKTKDKEDRARTNNQKGKQHEQVLSLRNERERGG